MAYHPDYPPADDGFDVELLEYSKYIVFYLVAVANENNISLIFHIAQRVKQMRDNVEADDEHSQRLYVLSDLAQAVIRNFADTMPHAKGANVLQTWPGKVNLHKSLFRPMSSHAEAQKVAEKNYLPEDTALGLEKFVKDTMKQLKGVKAVRRPSQLPTAAQKRKSVSVEPDDDDDKPRKKKKSSLPIRKTPKAKTQKTKVNDATTESHEPSRKSARASNAISYAEGSSDEEEDDDDQHSGAAKRMGRHQLSSPAIIEVGTKRAKDNGGDTDMQENGNGIDIHEDDSDQDVGDDDRAVTPSPSPLKERENTPGPTSPAKKKGKQNGASKKTATAAEKKQTSAKATPVSSKRKSTAEATSATKSASVKKAKSAKAVGTGEDEAPVEENTRSTRATRRSRG
ncbi:uncharacterized protein AB675_8070 [Cyphellophora attinorum]|uniref:Uncharacterized protein n=1 Tax=Cyphellophora attinorum TaxID=1664694 RepID=A0A0N1H5N4_9EURO|nr:uncharacterized protein AB675_8070 [Phialophora attinorum]KPI41084.1 hypothetical protein AB675_8070 [Phialophora attinorum]